MDDYRDPEADSRAPRLSSSEKSELDGRIQAEIQKFVKLGGSIEAARKIEKHVASSYSRSGHPGAEVEVIKGCIQMATPKRPRKPTAAAAKKEKGVADGSDMRLRDNYGQINGPNAHDNTMTVNPKPAPRTLTPKDKAVLDGVDCTRGIVTIAKCTDEEGTGLFQQVVWDYLSRRGCPPGGAGITNCGVFHGIEVSYPPVGTDPQNGHVTIEIGYRTE